MFSHGNLKVGTKIKERETLWTGLITKVTSTTVYIKCLTNTEGGPAVGDVITEDYSIESFLTIFQLVKEPKLSPVKKTKLTPGSEYLEKFSSLVLS